MKKSLLACPLAFVISLVLSNLSYANVNEWLDVNMTPKYEMLFENGEITEEEKPSFGVDVITMI